jgi:hypothetical protein
MMRRVRSHALACAVAALVAGCGGSGKGLDQNGNPIGTGAASGGLTPDFASIQANIFTPICAQCHTGAGAPHGLRFDAGVSYGLLVGVPSDEVPSVLRVSPGNPNASYIIQKLQGTAAVGERMPFGGPYLSQATIDVIKQWITNGAQQATAPPTMLPKPSAPSLALEFSQPIAGSTVAGPLAHVVLGFSGELDTSLVNDTTVTVEQLGESGAATIPVALAVPAANPQTLIIQPQVPLAPGQYRVHLRGSNGGALADVGAHALATDLDVEFAVIAESAR